MTFRQYSKVFLEEIIVCDIFAVLSFTLIPALGAVVATAIAAFFLVVEFCTIKKDWSFITIDEYGIACTNKNGVVWKHLWNEISGFKKFTLYRNRGLCVLLYDKDGKPELFGAYDHDFQLCKSAKKALTEFCPEDKKRIWDMGQGTVLCPEVTDSQTSNSIIN